MIRLAPAAIALLLLAACAHAPPAPVPRATLRLTCRPAAADLWVDGRFLGPCRGRRSVRVRAGLHRIELRSPGHFAHYAVVRLPRGAVRAIAVTLRRRPF